MPPAIPNAASLRWLDRQEPDSVVVFRALQIGDMLCAVPALRALRQRLPNARIVLVGLPWARDFATRVDTLIDEFIAFPGYPGLPERTFDTATCAVFIKQLRERRFALALQLHGSGSVTNPLVAQFGAAAVAGFCDHDTADARWIRYPQTGHEIHRLLELTTHLGAASSSDALAFPLRPHDAHELAHAGFSLPPEGTPYACLHPGARDPARRWPIAHFAALGDALVAQGLQVVVTGSQQEQPLGEAVLRAMRAPAVNAAAAPLSVGAMAQLMAGATLLVCNDTGVSHIACGLELPSVVVFRASDMTRWAPLDQERHRAVWDPDARNRQAVLDQAFDLLTRTSANSASAASRTASSVTSATKLTS